jgi:predicted transcriptional regulator
MTEEFTTADLIDELQAYVNEERPPGGVTVNEWAKAECCSKNLASARLLFLVEEGVLTRVKARVDGRRRWVYYKTTPEALASQ